MAAAPSSAQQPQASGDTPRRPYTVSPDLAFDAEETLPTFFARRQAAKDAGKQAWHEGKINGDQLMVYEYLVDMVGAHRYGWKKECTMGAELNVPYSTLKRWIAKIEAVPLVRRERQFQTSSRTYITYYDQLATLSAQHEPAPTGAASPPASQSPPHQDTPPQDHTPASILPSATPATRRQHDHDEGVDTGDSFFGPEREPSFGSFVDRQIKESPLNAPSDSGINGGGKKYTFDITKLDPVILAIINQENVITDRGKEIVAARPVDELRAVQQYTDKQRNIKDRAGFLVWAAETGFGADLLAGRVRAAERSLTRSTASPTPRRRAARTQPHPRAEKPESDYRCVACGHFSAYLGLDDGWCDRCGVRPGDELGKNDNLTPDPELWTAILNRLNIDDVHRDLWLAPTMIAHYANYADYVILACPHKMVCNAIHTYYLDHIEAVASTILGRPVRIDDVKVKYMPQVTEAQRAAWEISEEQDASTAATDGGDAASTPQCPQWGNDPWPKMVAHVNPPAEMYPFFERCYVAHYNPEQVLVIATPNCIVRDELHDMWLSHLQDAAAAVLRHTVTVEFVINDDEAFTRPGATDQRGYCLPAPVADDEAHTTLVAEQVHATASRSGGDAGEDMHHHDRDELNEEEREHMWRSIPWRLPIEATERAMWFPQTRLHECANGRATVTAPTAWQVEQLKRYQDLIEDELGLLLGTPIVVAIVVARAATAQAQQEHEHNGTRTDGGVDIVRDRGTMDTLREVDHECLSTCERSAPAPEGALREVLATPPPREAAAAAHDPEVEHAATWEQVIAHLNLDIEERRTWLDPTTLVALDRGRAIVAVPSVFIGRAVEHRYRTGLEAAISTLLGQPLHIELITTTHSVGNVL